MDKTEELESNPIQKYGWNYNEIPCLHNVIKPDETTFILKNSVTFIESILLEYTAE